MYRCSRSSSSSWFVLEGRNNLPLEQLVACDPGMGGEGKDFPLDPFLDLFLWAEADDTYGRRAVHERLNTCCIKIGPWQKRRAEINVCGVIRVQQQTDSYTLLDLVAVVTALGPCVIMQTNVCGHYLYNHDNTTSCDFSRMLLSI